MGANKPANTINVFQFIFAIFACVVFLLQIETLVLFANICIGMAAILFVIKWFVVATKKKDSS